jgi:hypothetical protein
MSEKVFLTIYLVVAEALSNLPESRLNNVVVRGKEAVMELCAG